MDINVYLKPLAKWWWLIVVATILAVISSAIATSFQPPEYISRTTLMVGRSILDPNPDTSQLYLAQGLASTYADIANREPIQVATMKALGIEWLPSYLARALPQTQLIEITVRDSDPKRAQVVASELANQLILLTPVNSDPSGSVRQKFIEDQLNTLQTQIVKTRDEIDQLTQKIGDLNSAREIANTQSLIDALDAKLLSLQTNYASMLSSTKEGAANIIQLLEPATLPTKPVGPNEILVIALAAMVGAVIAGGAAYLIEFFNKTFDTSEDVERELGYPVLGNIPRLRNSTISWTYIDSNPISHFAESFRNLRTNIEVRTKNINNKSLLVCSAMQGEGKSTTAINLALAYSYLGKSVIIVDTDIRRPKIHEALSINLEPGLSDIILGESKIPDVIQHWKGYIFAIPSGKLVENANELLSTRNFLDTMTALKEIADIVILDGPPYFLSDSSVMSTIVDGVLIVVSLGGSEKDMVRKMRTQLEMIKAPVIGVAVNKNVDLNFYGYYDQGKDSKQKVYLEGVKQSLFKEFTRKTRKFFSSSKKKKLTTQPGSAEIGFPVSTPTNFLNIKTVPRIANPKSILEQVILRSYKNTIDEDKAFLQDIADKKRGLIKPQMEEKTGELEGAQQASHPDRIRNKTTDTDQIDTANTKPSNVIPENIGIPLDSKADVNTFLDSLDPAKKPGKSRK